MIKINYDGSHINYNYTKIINEGHIFNNTVSEDKIINQYRYYCENECGVYFTLYTDKYGNDTTEYLAWHLYYPTYAYNINNCNSVLMSRIL